LFSSSFEFPGRYTRWDMGFVDPPLVFTARGRRFSIEALNERGRILFRPVAERLARLTALRFVTVSEAATLLQAEGAPERVVAASPS